VEGMGGIIDPAMGAVKSRYSPPRSYGKGLGGGGLRGATRMAPELTLRVRGRPEAATAPPPSGNAGGERTWRRSQIHANSSQ
jgi:hypothetical protein